MIRTAALAMLERHVAPFAAAVTGEVASSGGAAVGGGAAAGASSVAEAATKRRPANDVASGVAAHIGQSKDPVGGAVRKGAAAVNSGIGSLRSIADAGASYADIDAIDRLEAM